MNQVPGFTNYYQQQGTSKRNGLSNNPIIPHNTNSANHQLQQVLAQAGHLGGVKIIYIFLFVLAEILGLILIPTETILLFFWAILLIAFISDSDSALIKRMPFFIAKSNSSSVLPTPEKTTFNVDRNSNSTNKSVPY